MNQITYQLKPVAPFRLDFTVWALRRRPDNIIDQWDGKTYRRVLIVEHEVAGIEVIQNGTSDKPLLEVTVTSSMPPRKLRSATTTTVEKILGTQVNLAEFYQFAEQEKNLGPLILQFRGVKPPRFPTLFEALLNSISCQQISLNVCVRLLNRLVENWGRSISLSNVPVHAFPEPEQMLNIEPETLRTLGYSYNKARAILELVSLITSGKLNLEEIARLDDGAAISNLMKLRGVGHWTAEYTLLRGAGRTHIFPTGDAGALHNLQRWLGNGDTLDSVKIQRVLNSWAPYVGLVYFHLLLRKLSELGYLNEETGK